MIYLSFLLVYLAGTCNGVMDIIKHHWYKSIFKNIKNKFWFRYFHAEGWRNSYLNGWDKSSPLIRKPFTVWLGFRDAWHAFKSFMLVLLTTAIIITPQQIDIWFFLLYLIGFRLIFSAGFYTTYYGLEIHGTTTRR